MTTTNQTTPMTDWAHATDDDILSTDLLIALGLESLSDEDKAGLIDRMITTVQKAVAKRVYDELPEHLQITLTTVAAGNDSEKLNEFLMTHVPNYDDLVQEELVKFKRSMLAGDKDADAPAHSATAAA